MARGIAVAVLLRTAGIRERGDDMRGFSRDGRFRRLGLLRGLSASGQRKGGGHQNTLHGFVPS
jgi:hypothetical protein